MAVLCDIGSKVSNKQPPLAISVPNEGHWHCHYPAIFSGIESQTTHAGAYTCSQLLQTTHAGVPRMPKFVACSPHVASRVDDNVNERIKLVQGW